MKTACAWIFTAALALAATQAQAAAAAMVEGVQMPAWVERGAERIPLAPGMELKTGDQLNTGAGSRVVVKGEPAVTLNQPLQFYSRQEGRTQPSCAAPATRRRSSRRRKARIPRF